RDRGDERVSWLLPLPVVIPLLAAAVNTAGDHVLRRRAGDVIAIGATAASFVFSVLIMVQSMQHELTHWFGGWRPRSGVALGIALLYGKTGALNLAQIGRTLSGQRADGLEIVAFTLLLAGFLIKAAIVPFHAWLADAHAVAPAPVCVLFSGIMVELGLLGVARVYWTMFDAPFEPHAPAVRNVLVTIGVVTALLGAVMAFVQRHLKRLLAYS